MFKIEVKNKGFDKAKKKIDALYEMFKWDFNKKVRIEEFWLLEM